jgi:thioredoxin-like negative regulator of GroEL
MANERNVIDVQSRFEFQQYVLKSAIPAMVAFLSGRDHGSRKLLPKLRALAAQYAGQARFVTVDAGVANLLDADYGIRRTPTVILFDGGRELGRWTNEPNVEVYRKALERLLMPAVAAISAG